MIKKVNSIISASWIFTADKNNTLLVLAWNFYDDIKKNNSKLSNNFVNIKELESSN